jgi:hypothetical protein
MAKLGCVVEDIGCSAACNVLFIKVSGRMGTTGS